jgi:ATP-dependent protease ClpP protease subunit
MQSNKDVNNKTNFVSGDNIFIYGDFDDSFVQNIIDPFNTLITTKKTLKDAQVHIHINSNGGYTKFLYAMLALVESAKKLGIKVNTYVDGHAYSCASILAASGTKGCRIISEFSEHVIHLGSVTGIDVSTDLQLERIEGMVKTHFENMRKLYKKYAEVKNLNTIMKDNDYYLFGQQIIDNGLADILI